MGHSFLINKTIEIWYPKLKYVHRLWTYSVVRPMLDLFMVLLFHNQMCINPQRVKKMKFEIKNSNPCTVDEPTILHGFCLICCGFCDNFSGGHNFLFCSHICFKFLLSQNEMRINPQRIPKKWNLISKTKIPLDFMNLPYCTAFARSVVASATFSNFLFHSHIINFQNVLKTICIKPINNKMVLIWYECIQNSNPCTFDEPTLLHGFCSICCGFRDIFSGGHNFLFRSHISATSTSD